MNVVQRFRDLSIRRKQMLLVMATSSAALLLACGAFITYENFSFRREETEKLSSLAQVVGNNTTAALDFNDPNAAAETLAGLRAEPNIVAAGVFDRNKKLFASYTRPGWSGFEFPAPQAIDHEFSQKLLHVFRPVDNQGEVIGTIYLASDLSELADRLWRYAGIVGLVLAASLVVTLALSSQVSKVVTDPILQLAGVARAVAVNRNYSLRARKRGEDEIGELTDAFNEMLGEIQQRDDALQEARENLERRVEERTAALKLAQVETARERARFKFIFDSVPVGISWFVPGEEGTHLVNPAHERITGISAEESCEPGAFARVSHPDDYRMQQALTPRFLSGEIDSYTVEKRYLHPDGTVVWAVLSSRMFVDPATGTRQSVTTLVDITERKQAEEELANSVSLLNATLESTTDGILALGPNGKIICFNANFVALWGYPADMVARRDAESMIAFSASLSRDPDAFYKRIESSRLHPEEETFDVIELADGRVLERVSRPAAIQNTCVGSVLSFRDVTARKQAEAELEKAHRELVESSRMAGMAEVATGVLHNVGNVLNSVNVSATLVADRLRQSEARNLDKVCALLRAHEPDLGAFLTSDPKGRQIPRFLDMLASHLTGERTEIAQELDALRLNVDHIKEIVAMQQSYAKVSGVVESVSVEAMVEDALRLNAGALVRHEVKLVRDYQTRPTILVEKHKVLQILINLIRNAKYACDESGRGEKQITVRIDEADGRVRIAVADNGVGIPPENITRIFNHGFTTRSNGHGFGLHSGALAAKEMGGRITVASDGPGMGATFVLELPFGTESRAA